MYGDYTYIYVYEIEKIQECNTKSIDFLCLIWYDRIIGYFVAKNKKIGGLKMKIKIDVSKLEKLVSPEIMNQLLEDCEKPSKLVEKYGEKLPFQFFEDVNFIKSLLQHSIIILFGNEAYTLPLKVDGRVLKLYYRKEK